MNEAVSIGAAFDWHRDPRPEWVERLQGIAARSEVFPSLTLAWEAGHPEIPIQRWMAFVLQPIQYVGESVLRELQGPHPWSTGHLDKAAGLWRGGATVYVRPIQWDLYRLTGQLATPFWVIQGPNGGHRFSLNPWESRLSQLVGGPADTPCPGDLPYAEPDERTWARLAESDQVRRYQKIIEYGMRRPMDLDAEDEAACEHAARKVVEWFGLRAAEDSDEMAFALRRSDIPRPASWDNQHIEPDTAAAIETTVREVVRDLRTQPENAAA